MRKIYLLISVLTILLFSLHNLLLAHQNIKLLESSDSGVTIEYTPKIIKIDTIKINNESYLKIHADRSKFDGTPGDPIIPFRTINIGMPLTGQATVKIISTELSDIHGKLLPVPEIDKLYNYKYKTFSEIYSSNSAFPENIIKVGAPKFIRNQRFIQIRIYSLQYLGSAKKSIKFDKIQLRVDFSNYSKTEPHSLSPNKDDNFYSGTITNYSHSKKWLKSRTKKLYRTKTNLLSNNWYKITIRNEGMYKITGEELTGKNIDISSIDPKSFRIYNNGGKELPKTITTARPDSLIENAIRVVEGNDGIFNNSDYILFFGKSVESWEPHSDSLIYYQHYLNHYTNENVYWLTWDNATQGKQMENIAYTPQAPTESAEYFNGLYFDEDELDNFIHSGYHWFGRLMAGESEQRYSVYLPNAYSDNDNIFFRFRCYALTSSIHKITIMLNNQLLTSYTFSGRRHLIHEVRTTIDLPSTGYNSLKVLYDGGDAENQIYIDWFEVQYKKQFIAEDDHLFFNQIENGPQSYQISNFQNDQIEIYDITSPSNVKIITNTQISSGSASFSDSSKTNSMSQYLALTPEAYLSVTSIEHINFADLRNSFSGADFIIITHDDFYDAVLPLQQHRETYDNLKTEVIKISDIFNEFSWGLVDPTAIRDFLKFAYENGTPSPEYVLLCGDGDFDYKNIISDLDKNWLPPYQTTELNENSNRTIDEWFVYVSGDDEVADMAIGRFPVQTAEETKNVVDKILNYETGSKLSSNENQSLEDWRNIITMVGDDEYHTSNSANETMHTNDAEYLIENFVPNYFNKEKVYLIEFPAEINPATSGFKKPAATEALLNKINSGCLIINYVGHGAPAIWADERLLLESRDFERIQNIDKLPLWVAATCDFGRFDDPQEQGFSERLFSAKQRGGVAFITSARLAYASDNTALNRFFYSNLFLDNKTSERLGVALANAKLENSGRTNDQKYHLFGDPTMRLALPKNTAKITSLTPDTLKALSEITVSGEIMHQNSLWSDFEGKALLKVFDSKENKIYYTPYNSAIRYRSPGKTIFRGNINVRDGHFEAKFIIPKDITYGGKLGRVSLYFANEEFHGNGYRDSLMVGGTSYLQDKEGPLVKIGFENQNIFDGNIVSGNSVLEVEIADSVSGVNIAGDIGHNITMIIDDQENDKIILTDFFNYYEGNYRAGKIKYDFSTYQQPVQSNETEAKLGLDPGEHKITIKAWDNFNNSSIVSSQFTVVNENVLKIKDVLNYPNPFSKNTTFTFVCNMICEVKIKIYTINGRLIQTLDNLYGEAGINQIFWNGRDKDEDFIANGVYLYKIIATANHQNKTLKDESIGKLVIAR